MTTASEMAAIRATFSARGVQETLPLLAAGYREPSVESLSYPFLPVPITGEPGTVEFQNAYSFMTGAIIRYGHCGQ